MQDYYRIVRSKFWMWVVVCLAIGFAAGMALFVWRASTDARRISNLERQIDSTSTESSAAVSDLASRVASAEARVLDLESANAQLQAELASATTAAQAAATAAAEDKIEFVSRSVSPSSVDASGSITLTVKVKGHPDKVRMQITGPGGYDKMYYLSKVSTVDGVETWRKTVSAPGTKGVYRYYAGAFKDGKKTVMPGVSAWSFEVK